MTELQQAIAKALAGTPAAQLRGPAADMSRQYRAGGELIPAGRLRAQLSPPEVAAYLATRMPATAAAATEALRAVAAALPGYEPATQLDLGAGPGAAAWAAADVWPSLSAAVLLDGDPAMLAAAEQLVAGRSGTEWAWRHGDLVAWAAAAESTTSFELVTAAYALGELGLEDAWAVTEAAWRATAGCLVIVEPGTPSGFALVRELRGRLIAAGAPIAAPCPSDSPCPMPAGDWCHFAARLNRSALHRKLKEGERSFEDEKFSYVAVARVPIAAAPARVVRRPTRRRRLVQLTACRGDELVGLSVGQSNPAYRQAVDIGWGDAIPEAVLG